MRLIAVGLIVAGLGLVASAGCCLPVGEMMIRNPKMMKRPSPSSTAATPPAAEATSPAAREVRVNLSGGFSPTRIEVRKGEPLRLVFLRDEKPTCATEVIFPSLNLRRELPVGKTVSIDLTPTKAGDLVFTCGMDMLRGKLVVLEQ